MNTSVAISSTAKVPAMMMNWTKRLRAGSMNCGRKAVKKRSALGLVSAESAPCWNSDQPALGSAEPLTSMPIGGERSEEHTSELQSLTNLVCRLLLEKKNKTHQHKFQVVTVRTPRTYCSNIQS